MKINIYKPLFFITLTLIVLFAVSGWVYAAYQATFSIDVEIVTGIEELTFYTDLAMSTPSWGYDLKNVPRGNTITKPIYVKNTGIETLLNLLASFNPSIVTWGDISLQGADIGTLSAGQSKLMYFELYVPISVPTGNYTGLQIIVK